MNCFDLKSFLKYVAYVHSCLIKQRFFFTESQNVLLEMDKYQNH